MQQRLPSKFARPILFAHRGAKAHSPENTLESFALASRLGATGIETDVWITKDKQVVCDHDGLIKKGFRSVRIDSCLRSELPGSIPTLEEVFEKSKVDENYSIDICDPLAIESVNRLICEHGDKFAERVWLCHPDFDLLCSWREQYSHLQFVNSIRLRRISEGVERRCANLSANGICALNMHHTDWNGGLVALAHRFNLAAFSWDIQHLELLRDAYRMGVDAVFSDWPDRMVDAYKLEFEN